MRKVTKLKTNVWIRQPEPEPEPEPLVSTESLDASVYCYFTDHGLKAGYTGEEELQGTRGEYYDRPPLRSSLSRGMRDTVERDIEKERIREQIIEEEIEKERIREQIIEREIEKERIREQIIMSERRALEEEIRYELMLLEKELARRRKSKPMLLGLPPVTDPMEISVAGPIVQSRPVDERTVFCTKEETVSNGLRCGSQASDTLPFKRGDEDPIRSEVKPVPVTEKRKEDGEKLALLAKPDARVSVSKMKAVTLSLADTSLCASDNISNKKAKAVLPPLAHTSICASDASASVSKRKAVTLSLADTSLCASDNISNKKAKALQPPLEHTSICASDNVLNKEDKAVTPPLADTSICASDNISNKKAKAVTPPLADTSICASDNTSNKEAKDVTPPLADTEDISNKKSEGELSCQVIAPTESSPSPHLQGKKRKMKEAGKNYDVGLLRKSPSLQKKIAVDSLPLKKNEDSSAKRNVLPQLLKPNNLKKKEETVQKLQKNSEPNKTNYMYWCEMCQVGGPLKVVKDSHEKGKKHLKRLKRSQNWVTGTCNTEKKIEVHATSFQEVAKGSKDLFSNVEVKKRDETKEKIVDAIKPGFKMNFDSESIEDGEIVG